MEAQASHPVHRSGGPRRPVALRAVELWPWGTVSGPSLRRLVVVALVTAAALALAAMVALAVGGHAGAHGWPLLRGAAGAGG